ncbi:uncharacterized protein [Henckelia pumila]|uniref:uncharacterized protein n=1 Tax=Henckelia pumila TaxID=405737 RepID=UPI003C6E151C
MEGEEEPVSRPEKEKNKGIHVEVEGNSHAGSANVTMAGELEMLKQKIQKLDNTDPQESSRVKSLGCPFFSKIIGESLPVYFKSAKIKEYDGSADPEEHRWFENLKEGSIMTFKEFREVFLQHFSSSKRYKKTTLSFFEIKQLNEESLRAYFKKFNRVALEVPACAPETKITAFTQGLKEGEFFRSLVKRAPRYFEDLLARAEKYINMEEAQRQKREKDRKEENRRRKETRVIKEEEDRINQGGLPLLLLTGPGKYCSIHRVNTHDTNECQRLIVEPGQPIPEETKHVEKNSGDAPGYPGSTPSEAIGPTPRKPGRDSNRARKSWSKREVLGIKARRPDPCPVITFGPEDLEEMCLPHNDALLIRTQVANYDIRRVFVDSGSSVNVIFQDAFEKMDLRGCEVNAIKTSQYGFTGHTIRPKGEVRFPIMLGSGDTKKTVMALFTVVEALSSYNIILGRPALNTFRAVASAYHQKIKFPVGD